LIEVSEYELRSSNSCSRTAERGKWSGDGLERYAESSLKGSSASSKSSEGSQVERSVVLRPIGRGCRLLTQRRFAIENVEESGRLTSALRNIRPHFLTTGSNASRLLLA
jgi:hypothetical protein